MEQAPNRNTADAARFRMAQSLESLERYEEALAALRGISDETGMAGARTFIPAIEKKLVEQRAAGERQSKSDGKGS